MPHVVTDDGIDTRIVGMNVLIAVKTPWRSRNYGRLLIERTVAQTAGSGR